MLTRLFPRKAAAAPETDGPTPGELKKEAGYYARLLSDKLAQLDVCYRYRKSEKDVFEKGVQKVTFNMAVTHPDALYLRVDTSPRRFPRGISLAMINDDAILTDLSVVAERPIKYKRTQDGAWLVIEREMGVFGIRQIGYNELEGHYPSSSLKPLQVPLGLTYNKRIIYRSLAEFPHALVGGATGAGKTTFLHAWICALIQHNRPGDMRLALIDLKGGTEFTRYQRLPHVLEGGFVKDEDDVRPLLETLEDEMKRRLDMFEKKGGIQNLAQWNVRAQGNPARFEHLPRIALFVDELSAVMLKTHLRKDAVRLFTTLGERGRAPGIHLVLATQRPIVRVVDGQIKGNLEARFAFRVTDDTSSMVILDSIEAARFPEDTPRGRYIYKSGLERMELQAPLITPMQIKRIVTAVERGDYADAEEAAAIAPEDVFRASLRMGGDFSARKLYKALEGRASMRLLEALSKENAGQIVELDGVLYRLCNPERPGQPRRLRPVAEAPLEESGLETATIPTPTENPAMPPQLALPGPTPTPREDTADWLRFALRNSNGLLGNKKLAAHFHVGHEKIGAALAALEGKIVELDGATYTVLPGRGTFPRRIVKHQEAKG